MKRYRQLRDRILQQIAQQHVATGQASARLQPIILLSDAAYRRVEDAMARGMPVNVVSSLYQQYVNAAMREGATTVRPKPGYVAPEQYGPKYLRGGGPTIVPVVSTARVVCHPLRHPGFGFVPMNANWRPIYNPGIFSVPASSEQIETFGEVFPVPCNAIVQILREQTATIRLRSGLFNINQWDIQAPFQYVKFQNTEGWMFPDMLERL
jgi:hypothetical protein